MSTKWIRNAAGWRLEAKDLGSRRKIKEEGWRGNNTYTLSHS
jgi:hypothetical protein